MIRQLLGIEKRSVSFQDVFGAGLEGFGHRTSSGQSITADSALQVSAVWGCHRILSDNIATLPLEGFIKADGLTLKLNPQPVWTYFETGPLNKIDVLTQIMMSLLGDGNAYVATYRDPQGNIIYLEVLDPSQVTPVLKGSSKVFRVNGTDELTSNEVLHIPGLMLPGTVKGLSPITYARETIGVSMAATKYGAAFFGNGAVPGMAVEIPGKISDIGVAQLKNAWNDAHQGVGNSHKLAALTEGAKFSKVSINPDEAQFLQTRQFQVPDIARIYGVPPHLLADASGSTSWGSGLAEQNSAFVQHSLRPWVERIELAFSSLLRSEGRPREAYVKLDVNGLMRGAYKDRIASYAVGLAAGIYTADEVRSWEDLSPLESTATPVSPEHITQLAELVKALNPTKEPGSDA